MAYRGDVHPFVPIATELADRGHDVTFVVPREFHHAFAAEPFSCVHSGSDFAPSALDEHGPWLARWGMRFGGARLLELYFGEFTVPHLPAMYEAVYSALDGADLLISHSTAALVGAMAAEARDLPWISGDLFPMLIPTETSSPAPNVPSLGRIGNRLMWRLARSTRPDRLSYAGDFASFRRRLGLRADRRSPIDLRISPHENLGMVSPHYVPPAPDWPDHYTLTGFTHWGEDAGDVPADVEAFLEGAPPVLVTLGTLAAATHPERFDAAIDAADAVGRRTLSLCSRTETAARLSAERDPARHLAVPYAPLARVLPRVAAVVHSGSHGTNSMTLAAGKPSVIVPSIFDQLWHAKRQQALGTGVHSPQAKGVRDAVRRVCDDPELTEAATRFAAKLANEDGVTAAADRIEDWV